MKLNYAIILFFLFPTYLIGQQTKGLEQGKEINIPYVTRPLGYFQGQATYYFSVTENMHHLKSDYAHAIGFYGKYESPIKYGFQAAFSGYAIFNPGSSDFTKLDSITHQPNRYEIGLFDIENPSYTDPIKKLEECYIRYQSSKIKITWGQQLLSTPFFNLQDGRMRPTGADALWAKVQVDSGQMLEGGWIYHVSPRSTIRWMDIGSSVGIYPVGVNDNGKKSNYANHIQSDGLLILGYTFQLSKSLKGQFWETYADNLFHVSFIQFDWQKNLRQRDWKYYVGLQNSFQKTIGDGGNIDPNKAYIQKGNSAHILSMRLGIKNKQQDFSLNYTRIFPNGQFLFPREWGREPFFTFMPRERNEGASNVHAFVFKSSRQFQKLGLSTGLMMGYFHYPAFNDYAQNKYTMPSYGQINVDAKYILPFAHKKIDMMALMALKWNASGQNVPLKNLINKVDMILINFVTHYNF